MSVKKMWAIIAVVLVAALAIGATLAYLTDRDSEVNTFTVGDVSIDLVENFDEENAKLIPGVDITKEARITNTGDNDAWVWMTMAVPVAFDDENADTGAGNPLHWNVPGVVWKGYGDTSWATDLKVQTALDNGFITEEHIDAESGRVKAGCLWTICQEEGDPVEIQKDVDIDGVKYNVYTFLYNGVLAAGDTTPVALHKVFFDTSVDINTDGEMYMVKDGNATALNWNYKTDGEPQIYVSAYAIQTEGFNSVEEAYKAYQTQWGDNSTEYATPAP